ncbi:hypothetical protein [Thermococcus sp.]|uniref:hypothetical protein n=1 Tax=Thermococcus sp. TaxID=35749 RepID=UPI00262487FD|nr:hypothetical protein [Thermococcus sp.]
MWEAIAVTAVVTVALVLYVRDVTSKVLAKYFELKDNLIELEENFKDFRSVIEKKISELRGSERSLTQITELKEIRERLTSLEKSLRDFRKFETKFEFEIGSVKNGLERLEGRVEKLERELEESRELIKEELKGEIIRELEEEIEHLEEVIERRKNEEVEEFLEVIKAAITLQPEKLREGLLEAKRALLSLRDIAKVYVLTGKGQREFNELKGNLVELLKNLRKLAIVSVPDENVYSKFNEVIVKTKRLELPMKRGDRELSPEKSFIEIHRITYELAGEIDRIAEMLGEPVPVTPVEKEFYEKLRYQFEELRRLEEQVQKLMLKLGAIEKEPEEKKDDIEEILKDLNLL